MAEPTRSGTELVTVSLICPLWGQVTEVTALWADGGLVSVLRCPLSEPGIACLAPCVAEVRRWCEYEG